MLTKVPSLNWLRVFEAAARFENFAAAARNLNMTAPAVSQQIKALEGYVGEALFERGPRSVILTGAGRAYLPSVRHALQSIEITTAALFGEQKSAPVLVQSVPIFAASWLALNLGDFYGKHPDIQVTLTTANQVEEFRFGYNDFNIVFGGGTLPVAQTDILFGETLVPVALPRVADLVNGPDDLLDYRLIDISSNSASWLNVFNQLEPVDLGRARFVFVDNTITAFSLAVQGNSIALARPPVTGFLQKQFGLVPCFPDLAGESLDVYRLIAHPGRVMTRPAIQFRDWLLDRASGSEPLLQEQTQKNSGSR